MLLLDIIDLTIGPFTAHLRICFAFMPVTHTSRSGHIEVNRVPHNSLFILKKMQDPSQLLSPRMFGLLLDADEFSDLPSTKTIDLGF